MAAQAICNRQVVGSTPTTGSFFDVYRDSSARARATSKKATAPAAATFSDSMVPCCGNGHQHRAASPGERGQALALGADDEGHRRR